MKAFKQLEDKLTRQIELLEELHELEKESNELLDQLTEKRAQLLDLRQEQRETQLAENKGCEDSDRK